MKRIAKTVDMGIRTRYTVTLLDVESQTSTDIASRRIAFLQEIANDGPYNGMIKVGPNVFQRLKMWHNGTQWVIELESEENHD